jgi:hypothetical protein
MDVTTDNCPWQIRDLRRWREGVLLTASADLLVAWHSPRCPRNRRPPHRLRTDTIDEIRQARLADDLDRLETACRGAVDLGRHWLPTSPLLDALAQLRLTSHHSIRVTPGSA